MRELVIYEGENIARPEFVARVVRVFTEHLAKNGLRLTGQRRLILNLFLKTEHHLTQDEIFSSLRTHGLGRATVFRTLKMLQECRLISAVVGQDGIGRFEINRGRPHHDHLICVECGRIREVLWPKLERLQEVACKRLGFTPKWHRHEVFGLCRNCSGKR